MIKKIVDVMENSTKVNLAKKIVKVLKRNNSRIAEEVEKHKSEIIKLQNKIKVYQYEIEAYQRVFKMNEEILEEIKDTITSSSIWQNVESVKFEEGKLYIVRHSKDDEFPMIADFAKGKLRFRHGVGSLDTSKFNPTEVYLPKSK